MFLRDPLLLTDAMPGGLFGEGSVMMIVILVGFVALMYFTMIFPQRKREKKLKEQISNMRVGDEAVTIGGVVGKVANIKDDEVTIATSVAHTMVTFKKSSISTIKKKDTDG